MHEPRLKTNLDTSFLKLIAIISMTIDHIGSAFFPEQPVFRWIGRIAFPLFCSSCWPDPAPNTCCHSPYRPQSRGFCLGFLSDRRAGFP